MAGDTFLARLLFAVGLLWAAACAPSVCAQDSEARIWTDKSGRHEIRAKFIDVVDGAARLERPNGDITRVPLENLSQADRKYIRAQAKSKKTPRQKPAAPAAQGLQVGDKVEAEHFGEWREAVVTEIDHAAEDVKVRIVGEDDFAWHMSLDELRLPGTRQRPVLVKPGSPTDSRKTTPPNYDDMQRLVPEGHVADHVAADPLVVPHGNRRPAPTRLSRKSDFFAGPAGMALVAAPSPRALVLFETPGFDGTLPMLELVDLEARKVTATAQASAGTETLAVSPRGTRAASAQGTMHADEDTGELDIWIVDDERITRANAFAPYAMETWPDLDPEWFEWLDETRLFTVNREGQLILWDAENARAIYELTIDRGAKPILTHGRKDLVVPTSAGVQFFDAATGRLAAVIGAGDYRRGALALSPSGKQLAIASQEFIDVLDVTTGETTRSFPCEGVGGRSGVSWIDEDYLFVAEELIVHVPLRVIAWKYEIDQALVVPAWGTHWALLDDRHTKSQVLVPLELPPPEAMAAVDNLDEEELLAVRPGDPVGIDVEIADDNFLADDVQRALSAALAEAGMKVEDDSSLRLAARMKAGETQKINYHMFGSFGRQGEQIEVTTRVYELELLQDGVPVWRRESVQSAPLHLHLQSGETTRAAIDRVMKPTADRFRGRLPSYVVRPEYREPLGTSKLSLDHAF